MLLLSGWRQIHLLLVVRLWACDNAIMLNLQGRRDQPSGTDHQVSESVRTPRLNTLAPLNQMHLDRSRSKQLTRILDLM